MNSTVAAKGSDWWRWIALPFAAILGSILGSAAFMVVQWFGMKMEGGYTEDGWYYKYILPTFAYGIFGWLFTFISFHVAPRGRFIAAVVMTTLFVAFCALCILFELTVPNPDRTTARTVQSVVGCIVGAIASIITAITLHNEHKQT
jgi:hypothetical protein